MRLQMGKDSAKRRTTEKQHLKRRRPVQVISRLVPFYFDLCPHYIFKRLNIFMHFEYDSSQTQSSSFSNSITKVFQFVFEWWLPFYECRQRIVRDFSLLICVWVSRFTQLFHQIPERIVECRRKKARANVQCQRRRRCHDDNNNNNGNDNNEKRNEMQRAVVKRTQDVYANCHGR